MAFWLKHGRTSNFKTFPWGALLRPTKSHASGVSLTHCRSFSCSHAQMRKSQSSSNARASAYAKPLLLVLHYRISHCMQHLSLSGILIRSFVPMQTKYFVRALRTRRARRALWSRHPVSGTRVLFEFANTRPLVRLTLVVLHSKM